MSDNNLMEFNYSPDEMADSLIKLAGCSDIDEESVKKDCIEALYQLKAIAENHYNADFHRTFWNVLQNITDSNQ